MECVELYRVWVAFGVGLFIGGVVGIVTMCILNAVRPIIRLTCEACCGNCKHLIDDYKCLFHKSFIKSLTLFVMIGGLIGRQR